MFFLHRPLAVILTTITMLTISLLQVTSMQE